MRHAMLALVIELDGEGHQQRREERGQIEAVVLIGAHAGPSLLVMPGLGTPDYVIALAEDVVAIGGSILVAYAA
jgi:hypothetical protein